MKKTEKLKANPGLNANTSEKPPQNRNSLLLSELQMTTVTGPPKSTGDPGQPMKETGFAHHYVGSDLAVMTTTNTVWGTRVETDLCYDTVEWRWMDEWEF